MTYRAARPRTPYGAARISSAALLPWLRARAWRHARMAGAAQHLCFLASYQCFGGMACCARVARAARSAARAARARGIIGGMTRSVKYRAHRCLVMGISGVALARHGVAQMACAWHGAGVVNKHPWRARACRARATYNKTFPLSGSGGLENDRSNLLKANMARRRKPTSKSFNWKRRKKEKSTLMIVM